MKHDERQTELTNHPDVCQGESMDVWIVLVAGQEPPGERPRPGL